MHNCLSVATVAKCFKLCFVSCASKLNRDSSIRKRISELMFAVTLTTSDAVWDHMCASGICSNAFNFLLLPQFQGFRLYFVKNVSLQLNPRSFFIGRPSVLPSLVSHFVFLAASFSVMKNASGSV